MPSGMPTVRLHIPRLGFELVQKTDVQTSRPALERAGYKCECCPREDNLRVCAGCTHGGLRARELVVLCPECRIGEGFKMVVAYRRARAR